jgi:cytochrome c biogenesis protein CcdA
MGVNVHISANMPVDVSTVRPKVDKAMKEPSMMTWMNASKVCFKVLFRSLCFGFGFIVGFGVLCRIAASMGRQRDETGLKCEGINT